MGFLLYHPFQYPQNLGQPIYTYICGRNKGIQVLFIVAHILVTFFCHPSFRIESRWITSKNAVNESDCQRFESSQNYG